MKSNAVLIATKDLVFRAKLEAVVRGAGGTPTSREPVGLAVVELTGASDVDHVRKLVGTGATVVAFGHHALAGVLRDARNAGATAVPNSHVESTVRELLR